MNINSPQNYKRISEAAIAQASHETVSPVKIFCSRETTEQGDITDTTYNKSPSHYTATNTSITLHNRKPVAITRATSDTLFRHLPTDSTPFSSCLASNTAKTDSCRKLESAESLSGDTGIPLIIHQFWLGDDPIPQEFLEAIRQNSSKSGNWRYNLWVTAKVLENLEIPNVEIKNYNDLKAILIEKNIFDPFLFEMKVGCPQGAKDLASFAVAHSLGGFIADLDFIVLKHQFSSGIKGDKYFTSNGMFLDRVCPCFFGFTKGHVFPEEALRYWNVAFNIYKESGLAGYIKCTRKTFKYYGAILTVGQIIGNTRRILGLDIDDSKYPRFRCTDAKLWVDDPWTIDDIRNCLRHLGTPSTFSDCDKDTSSIEETVLLEHNLRAINKSKKDLLIQCSSPPPAPALLSPPLNLKLKQGGGQ